MYRHRSKTNLNLNITKDTMVEDLDVNRCTYFRILSYSGARKSEILALKWSDIDFDTSTLNISKTLTRGLNNKIIMQPTKTVNGRRVIDMDNGFEDAFQYTVTGNGHNRLKSTNFLEQLNQEVRRREKIIRIFPNRASANRLIGAVLMDTHDEWISSTRKYIKFEQ